MQYNAKPMQYNVAIEGPFEPVLIDWGKSPGWVEANKNKLEQAARLSLLPKEGSPLPVVTVAIPPGCKWILFSRVFGQLGPGGIDEGPKLRLYAIGWQQIGGPAKAILWVYPNGAIEQAVEPSFVKEYLTNFGGGQ